MASEGRPTRDSLEAKRLQKKAERRRRLVMVGVFALIGVAMFIAAVYITVLQGTRGYAVSVDGERVADHVLVLVMGMDIVEPNRTDTLMLFSLNTETGHAGVLSIPRDTRVAIPGRSGHHRINVAYALGGPDLAVRTVESLLGVSIDYWMKLDFDGFQAVVETVGGVEMHIPRAMVYTDTAQGLYINLPAGTHRLNGEQALHYVRYRADGLGDVSLADPLAGVYRGRVERQLQFVRALAREVLQPAMLTRAPVLIPQLKGAVDSNLPFDLSLRLAGALRSVDPNGIEAVVLPGIGQRIGGAEYWVHDAARTKEAINRVLLGRDGLVTVEVWNGNGVAGAAQAAADRLRHDGFWVIAVGNADRYDYQQTRIIARNGHTDEVDAMRRALGGASVETDVTANVEPRSNEDPDFIVILGQDFRI